jgi:hypothetical protein
MIQRSSDAGGAAGQVRALALRVANDAFEAYRALAPAGERDGLSPDRVVPGASHAPAEPLAAALADLASASFAGAQMLGVAGLDSPTEDVTVEVEAVQASTRAAIVAGMALADGSRAEALLERIEMTHLAAQSAHLAAHLLHRGVMHRPGAWLRRAHRPPPFPLSRRALLRELSTRLDEARRRTGGLSEGDESIPRPLLEAAAAARDAATHVVSAYEACTTTVPACRFARIVMRATCNAGFATLEFARVGDS